MKIKTTIIVSAIMVLALAGCKYFKKNEFKSVAASDLTAFIDLQPEQAKLRVSQDKEQRKELIKKAGEMYSLAQAAEAEGLENTEQFKAEFDFQAAGLAASMYQKRNPAYQPTQQEKDAYVKSHQSNINNAFKVLIPAEQQKMLTDENKQKSAQEYANVMLSSEKGKSEGVAKDPSYLVQLKLMKASSLARAYSKKLYEQYKVTPELKQKYIKEHPEADPDPVKIQQRADDAMARINKGENFEKLASQLNFDATKQTGGDLDWFTEDKMIPEFSKVAFAMKKGETTKELVKTQFGNHIIRVDDIRTVKEGDKSIREVKARHILIGPIPPQLLDKLIYEAYVLPKLTAAIEATQKKFPVALPDDFKVNVGPAGDKNKTDLNKKDVGAQK